VWWVVVVAFIVAASMGAVPLASSPDQRTYRLRASGWLPTWRLFAPTPIDYRVALVVRSLDGSSTEEAELAPLGRHLGIGAFFNPRHRRLKGLEQATASLMAAPSFDVAVRSSAYAHLMAEAARIGGPGWVQFALVRSMAGADPVVLFSSDALHLHGEGVGTS